MIETEAGLRNLEDILSVPGLDGVYIGPADLGKALGREAKLDQTDKVVVDAIDHIIRTTRANGLHAGIHNGTAKYARHIAERGADFVTILSDARLLANAAGAMVNEFRAEGESAGAAAAQIY